MSLAALIGVALAVSAGCELIVGVDHSKIDDSGEGGGGIGGDVGGGGIGGGDVGGGGIGGGDVGGGGVGGGGIGGSGGAPACAPPDCDDQNPCTVDACDIASGTCSYTSLDAVPTPGFVQVAGDCKVQSCVGGQDTSLADDADLPDDQNVCTSDACKGGVPSNMPLLAGMACGADSICDGMGHCIGCLAASDCPGQDDECKARVCGSGVCGVAYTPAGTPTSTQTSKDCKQNQCDGAGHVVSVPHDADLPIDQNECTIDACTNGDPSNTPNVGAACAAGLCDGSGLCVQCLTAADCPGQDDECKARVCGSGVCGVAYTPAGTPTSTQTSKDCKQNQCDGAGYVVSVPHDADLPIDQNECTIDACTNGDPSNTPNVGAACAAGLCDGSGLCVQCLTAADCPGQDDECKARVCGAGVCGVAYTPAGTPTSTQTSKDCKQNQCDGAGYVVSVPHDADLPDDQNACTSDVCMGGAPSNKPLLAGIACAANSICDGMGHCVGCLTAADCPGQDDECKVRVCGAGVCNVAYTPAGTPTSTQTSKDCKQNQCDGAGYVVSVPLDADLPIDQNECTIDACSNGDPSNTPNVGAACAAGLCNGSGLCVQCLTAANCPGQDNECKARVCGAFVCGVAYTAAGTPTISQTSGDCKKNICDGAGSVLVVDDDTDAGQLPPSEECKYLACVSGSPTEVNKPAGTPTATQIGGDCHKRQCDGAGGVVVVVDDTDPGYYAPLWFACKGYTCVNGVNTLVNLPQGMPCKHLIDPLYPAVCSGTGVCAECFSDTACPKPYFSGGPYCINFQCSNPICNDGIKNGPESDVDCGATLSELLPSCPPCKMGKVCDNIGDCESKNCASGICAPVSVSNTVPADGATGIAVNSNIEIHFLGVVNPSTLVAQTSAGACSGSVQVSSDDFTTCIGFTSAAPLMGEFYFSTAIYFPAVDLAPGTTYKIRLTTAVTDTYGNPGIAYTSATGFTTM